MLENDPLKRINSKNILDHPYFKSNEEKLKVITNFSNLSYNKNNTKDNQKSNISNLLEKKKFDIIANHYNKNSNLDIKFSWEEKISLFEKKLKISLVSNTQRFMKRSVDFENINDLIRILRNLICHIDDYNVSLIDVYHILNEIFPKFFINIYNLLLILENHDKKDVDSEDEIIEESENIKNSKFNFEKKKKYMIQIGQQYKKFIIGKNGKVKLDIEIKFNVKINCPWNDDNIIITFLDNDHEFKKLLKYILNILSRFGIYNCFYKKLQ
jgi:hypothetical protein